MELPKLDLTKERSIKLKVDVNGEGLLATIIVFGIGLFVGVLL